MHSNPLFKIIIEFKLLLLLLQNYDKGFRQQCSSNRPMLLPRLNSPSTPKKSIIAGPNPNIGMVAPSSVQMVEPLPVSDIFLCDYCGADFNTLTAIKVKLILIFCLYTLLGLLLKCLIENSRLMKGSVWPKRLYSPSPCWTITLRWRRIIPIK